MVFALGAGGVTGALGNAHSVLGLGFTAVAGFRSCYPVLILVGNGGITRIPVDGSLGAIGALGYTNSILALGFAAVAGLSGRNTVLILVGDSGVPRIRVGPSGSVTVAANGLTAPVFDAILRRQT